MKRIRPLYLAWLLGLLVIVGVTHSERRASNQYHGIAETKEVIINSEHSVEIANIYVVAGQLKIVQTLVSGRWLCLVVAAIGYALFASSNGGPLPLEWLGSRHWIARVLVGYINAWAWILCVLAWGAAYLNRPSRMLKYMNEAILPWYVLHQTVTIILAWYLSRLGMNIGLEATVVVLGTMLGCALGYELVRRWAPGRFLFGLKAQKSRNELIPNKPLPQSVSNG